PQLAVDAFQTLPGGQPNPNYGSLYATWVRVYPSGRFPDQPNSRGGTDIMFAVSHDGGATWTTQTQPTPGTGTPITVIRDPDLGTNATSRPGRGFMFYPHVAVGGGGDVYVSTYAGGDYTVYHSSNGGASFSSPNRTTNVGMAFHNPAQVANGIQP